MTPPETLRTPARVTLRQVAERAGVSSTTASFVLSGRRDMRVSADAASRVRQAARELNYRPNLLARGLRTNLSDTVGLLSDQVASEMFAGRGGSATARNCATSTCCSSATGGDPGWSAPSSRA